MLLNKWLPEWVSTFPRVERRAGRTSVLILSERVEFQELRALCRQGRKTASAVQLAAGVQTGRCTLFPGHPSCSL